jgi:hypothetical protein
MARKKPAGRFGPDSEYTIQKSIIELLDLKAPRLLYCASAGGVRTSLAEARRMKATGYKKGFPDLFFYEPRQGFNGLAIELKKPGGSPTPHQKQWKADLEARGYKAVVAKGRQACLDVINSYFSEDDLNL